ncbi:hypothetical protein GCM10017612_29270 [Novosphingobium resinovorum]|nr:hypothetical protein GCM10017612_29270 [Novosphingobium resinovorum]
MRGMPQYRVDRDYDSGGKAGRSAAWVYRALLRGPQIEHTRQFQSRDAFQIRITGAIMLARAPDRPAPDPSTRLQGVAARIAEIMNALKAHDTVANVHAISRTADTIFQTYLAEEIRNRGPVRKGSG